MELPLTVARNDFAIINNFDSSDGERSWCTNEIYLSKFRTVINILHLKTQLSFSSLLICLYSYECSKCFCKITINQDSFFICAYIIVLHFKTSFHDPTFVNIFKLNISSLNVMLLLSWIYVLYNACT